MILWHFLLYGEKNAILSPKMIPRYCKSNFIMQRGTDMQLLFHKNFKVLGKKWTFISEKCSLSVDCVLGVIKQNRHKICSMP